MARIRQITTVVFAVGASALLAGCAGGTDAPPAPTPSPQVAEPTPEATEPVEESTTVPLGGFPAGNPLEPGRYASHPGFDVPFAIELEPGWRSIRDDALGVISFVMSRTNSIGHATHWLSFFPAPPDVGSDELLDLIADQPDLVADDPEPASLGGATGTGVTARAEPDPGQGGHPEVEPGTVPVEVANRLISGGFWFTESPGDHLSFTVLDVGDRVLLVYVEAPPARFDAFAERAEEALATLTFPDAAS